MHGERLLSQYSKLSCHILTKDWRENDTLGCDAHVLLMRVTAAEPCNPDYPAHFFPHPHH